MRKDEKMIDRKTLDKVRELKNSYAKEWRKKNPDKMKEYRENYWIKKAELELAREKDGIQ